MIDSIENDVSVINYLLFSFYYDHFYYENMSIINYFKSVT